MAFDGAFLHKLIEELNIAVDSHIDKIYQPSRDELVFVVRKKGFVKRLYVSAKPGSARLHFTENRYENPQTPPNFCMLLRKYLSSARLVEISQPSLERIVALKFSASNEMGDLVTLTLICELIGNKTNLILTKDGKIIDAIRHSDVETADRLILPGATYEYPKQQDKLNPLTTKSDKILNDLSRPLSVGLLNKVAGFSPLVCREIELSAENVGIALAYEGVLADLKDKTTPVLILNPDKTPFDFSFTKIKQYGNLFENKIYDSFSALLDEFYSQKELTARIKSAAHDIIKLINNAISRTEKKLATRLLELEKCKDRESFRIYGELLKANLFAIKNGDKFAEVVNYYDPDLKTVKIPLNPALTPSKNADKYFKDYKKSYTAEQTLKVLTQKDKEELVYFESVLDAINRSNTLGEIDEIRNELCDAGYIKKSPSKKSAKPKKIELKEEISSEGYRILIGKNNIQNDYITTKLASKADMWFHTKNIPGSHVVVLSAGGELSDKTILKAATLAALNSKAQNGEKVAVDYTPIKYVKKPSGAKPGMVIYTTNKTVYVTPKENDL